ncbi:MAG TPA: mycothiol conjugate amidase Mca [Acidimicrobiaceae bacterium]|nr:mycothiol conjugate amidase Mca [Acidimicrobiaceae bacterium]
MVHLLGSLAGHGTGPPGRVRALPFAIVPSFQPVPVDAPLRLLTVHAHPDDEASKGAATVADLHARGVHCVLVCCTGGEAGEVLNPAMDRPEIHDDLAAIRQAELGRAAEVIGYDEVVMLGYRDSGMKDSEHNARPDCFANADHDEAVGRLVEIIRRVQPQVLVTYPDARGEYDHPDHVQVHDISVPAFHAAADPDRYPEAGPAWQPSKLYFTMWSRARIKGLHDRFVELGLESPYDDSWFQRPSRDHLITTRVPVDEHWNVRGEALRAHATQIDPESNFWFGLPDDEARTVYPFDDYRLEFSHVGPPVCAEDGYEVDLFAGIAGEVGTGTDSARPGV